MLATDFTGAACVPTVHQEMEESELHYKAVNSHLIAQVCQHMWISPTGHSFHQYELNLGAVATVTPV